MQYTTQSPTAQSLKGQKQQHKLDIDAIVNRAAVSLAKQQRLVDALLAQSSHQKLANGSYERLDASTSFKSDGIGAGEETETEDLVGREETSGLGAPLLIASQQTDHAGGLARARSSSKAEVDELRRKLLGKRNIQQSGIAGKAGKGGQSTSATGRKRARSESESEDDEHGRAGSFKSRWEKNAKTKVPTSAMNGRVGAEQGVEVVDLDSKREVEDANAQQSEEEWNGFISSSDTKASSHDDRRPVPETLTSGDSGPTSGSYLDEILSERADKKKKRKRRKRKKKHLGISSET